MKKHILLLAAVIFSLSISAQTANTSFKTIKIDSAKHSIKKLLESFAGEGIIIKNYQVRPGCYSNSFGSFYDAKRRLGLKEGLVLTTGSVEELAGKNTSANKTNGDKYKGHSYYGQENTGAPELEELLGGKQKTFDACVLELDIIPMADTISFTYLFGSEEYDEYVCSEYNDIFAFYISGKGISGERNLAVLPRTNIPVSINNVNNGNKEMDGCVAQNSSFYVSNADGKMNMEYDGFTRLLEIHQAVVAFETYHLKIAIADVSDDAYDSGVFIENKSLVSYHNHVSIPFESGQPAVSKDAQLIVERFLKMYEKHKGSRIEIESHTDSDGTDDLNYTLSQQRGEGIANYLVSQGVDRSLLDVKNAGEAKPQATNSTPSGKKLNRRVELTILGNNEFYAAEKALEDEKSDKAQLFQNFPNPASANTTIKMYIPAKTENAALMIYTMGGELVKVYNVLERGSSSVVVTKNELAAGTYIYHLAVNGKVIDSKKMVLQD